MTNVANHREVARALREVSRLLYAVLDALDDARDDRVASLIPTAHARLAALKPLLRAPSRSSAGHATERPDTRERVLRALDALTSALRARDDDTLSGLIHGAAYNLQPDGHST